MPDGVRNAQEAPGVSACVSHPKDGGGYVVDVALVKLTSALYVNNGGIASCA